MTAQVIRFFHPLLRIGTNAHGGLEVLKAGRNFRHLLRSGNRGGTREEYQQG
jgi:hypothetical protein